MPLAVRTLVGVMALACLGCGAGRTQPARTQPSPSSTAGNHPPSVRALCQPCTIGVGKTITLTADAKDADGDALTYTWSSPSGSSSDASAKQTTWTAPAVEGPVPVTVRVSDTKGGSASDVITIQVTRASTPNIQLPTPK